MTTCPHLDSRPVSAPRSLAAALRREAWLLVAAAVAGAALFGTASALLPKTYESRAEVTISPVSLDQRFGAPDAPSTPEAAIARELQLARSDAVAGRADAQIAFDHTIAVEQVDGDTIAFVGRSISGPFAESVANTAATTYLTVREETATGLANSAVSFTQGILDDLTARQAAGEDVGADLADQQARLADYQAGLATVGDTAQLTLEPTAAGGPVSPHPWRAAAKGLFVGLVAGLVIAALREWLLRRPGAEGARGVLPRVALTRVDGSPYRVVWTHRRRPAVVLLTALVLGRALLYAALGVNFVLDDWSLEYQRAVAGTWSSVPSGQDLVHARPGAWLTFTLLHGIVGPHPLVQFLVLTAVNVGVVVVLYLVLTRFFSPALGLLVAAVWVLLPIHQSMTVWSGTSQIAVAALLFLLGLWALTHGRWVLAGLGMGASILCYELTVPISFAALALAATPFAPLDPAAAAPRTAITWRTRLGALAFVVAATAWSRAHPVYDVDLRMPSPATLWSGHFGLGLFGSLDAPEKLAALVGALFAAAAAVCLVWWVRGDRARGDGPSLVVAGVGVLLLGLVVSLTASTGVLGFNDRLYAVSSVGAAMIVGGVARFLWARLPAVTSAVAVALLVLLAFGQFVSLRSWSEAGGDVVALLDYLERTYPDPAGTNFIVGPSTRYRNNVIGAQSPFGGADAAYRLTFPDAGPPCAPRPERDAVSADTCTGSLWIANTPEEFAPTSWGESLVDWSRVLGADGRP